jgi:hypothetical protein
MFFKFVRYFKYLILTRYNFLFSTIRYVGSHVHHLT